jgi:hypothetical protein
VIQLTRFKPYLQVGLWLIVGAIVVDAALTGLAATPVLAWLPRTTTGTGFLQDSRERVVRASEEYRLREVAPGDHLGVLVGISNMREAAELSVVNEAVGPGWRWLGVAGAGFGMGSFVQYADLILESDLRPDVVVLGLGLHQLVDPRPGGAAAADDTGIAGALRQGDVRTAVVMIRNSSWIYSRQRDVSVSVEGGLLEWRSRLMTFFGVPLSEDESRKLSPWREMVRMDWPDHFSAATIAAQEESLARAGIFDIASYRGSPVSFESLSRIIETFQGRGSKVVVVLLPEASTLNTRIPAEALNIFQERLRTKFGASEPPVLDYRPTIEDEGFVDLPHMNRQGRLEFSRKLGEDLRKLLPSGEPLMASQTRASEHP